MKKLLKQILCKLGFHDWYYTTKIVNIVPNNSIIPKKYKVIDIRLCANCGKRQAYGTMPLCNGQRIGPNWINY